MNDQLPLTDEQLQLATSCNLPASTQLDAETTSARKGFLVLGASLESAAGDFDEDALLSRISIRREQTCSRSRETNHVWPLILCGALAASAVFAIVRIASTMPSQNSRIAATTQPNRPTYIEQSTPGSQRSSLDFNDPLDDEIALAAATIQHYGSRGHSFDGSLRDMNNRIEALSQELLSETL